MPIQRFELERTALLVVDMQERLMPLIHNGEQVVQHSTRVIDGFNVLGRPILVTEQYRKGLGVTISALSSRLGTAVCNHEKLKFSACIEPIRAQLVELGVNGVLVCGIEAHVCVLQTCLELAEAGYIVGVLTDAVGSRRLADADTAIQRMVQAGIVPTTVESALLELVREAGTDRFKAILPLIK